MFYNLVQIVIQGDCKDELFDIIPEKWPEVNSFSVVVYSGKGHFTDLSFIQGTSLEILNINNYEFELKRPKSDFQAGF